MSQEGFLQKIIDNPGIEQCKVIDSRTTFNSRALKALIRKELIKREFKNNRYYLYPNIMSSDIKW
jgi:hypothetical protein